MPDRMTQPKEPDDCLVGSGLADNHVRGSVGDVCLAVELLRDGAGMAMWAFIRSRDMRCC
jgi:hypothetical protein